MCKHGQTGSEILQRSVQEREILGEVSVLKNRLILLTCIESGLPKKYAAGFPKGKASLISEVSQYSSLKRI